MGHILEVTIGYEAGKPVTTATLDGETLELDRFTLTPIEAHVVSTEASADTTPAPPEVPEAVVDPVISEEPVEHLTDGVRQVEPPLAQD